MSEPEKPADRVERYLVELLSDEYGAVFDGEPTPSSTASRRRGNLLRRRSAWR